MRAADFQYMTIEWKRRLMQQSHETSKRFWSDPRNRKKQSQRIQATKRSEEKAA